MNCGIISPDLFVKKVIDDFPRSEPQSSTDLLFSPNTFCDHVYPTTPSKINASSTNGNERKLEINDKDLKGESGKSKLLHRCRHDRSILVVAAGAGRIYAGTQKGEILVYSLETFQQITKIKAHKGAVLVLLLSKDNGLLFSAGGDRTVQVREVPTYLQKFCITSTYDVGDIFCLGYSTGLQTLYLGLQNTGIQWLDLSTSTRTLEHDRTTKPAPPLSRHQSFYDRPGPRGTSVPATRPPQISTNKPRCENELSIPEENILHFAHYGYVYCMLLENDTFSAFTNREVLITGGGDGYINVWEVGNASSGCPVKLFSLGDEREEGQSILCLARDGNFLYAGRSFGEINIWDLETRQMVRSLKPHRDHVMSVCSAGGFLFSASVTGYVRKFNRQYQMLSRFQAHQGQVLSSAVTRYNDRTIMITGGNDDTLAVWEVSDAKVMPDSLRKTTNEQMIEVLRSFISYKTVSSDARFQGDCRRGASYLRSMLKNLGAMTEMLPTENANNPIVYAKFRGNSVNAACGKKILFYGHYDVVAAENERCSWGTDPFTMEGINGYLYGRGISDNKGPVIAAIFACAELMANQTLAADVVFLIEGEEECGSRGFAKAVKKHKDLIGHIDWILLANSYWLDDRLPCLTYGLRGVIHASVQIESVHPDLHSGVDGSASLDESLKDLVMLLSTLTGKSGQVKLPGFYDSIPPINKEEKDLYIDITNALIDCNPTLGDSEELCRSLIRRWRDPSLTIHKFQTSSSENATIIPRSAKVALSLRLVPNQTADEISKMLTEHLHSEFEKLESANKLTVSIDHMAEPWLGDVTNKIFETLEEAVIEVWEMKNEKSRRLSKPQLPIPEHNRKESMSRPSPTTSNMLARQSVETAIDEFESDVNHAEIGDKDNDGTLASSNKTLHGQDFIRGPSLSKQEGPSQPSSSLPVNVKIPKKQKPLYIREGGSIPAIRFLELEFNAPAAHLPCGQASDSAHLDNERLRLINLYKSKDIFKKVFRDLPCK